VLRAAQDAKREAETARQEAEEVRRTAEAARLEAETIQREADAARQEAEELRRQAEGGQAAGRVAATGRGYGQAGRVTPSGARPRRPRSRRDTIRREAEATQKQADTIRREAEATRDQVEATRQEAEATKQEAEVTKQEAESVLREATGSVVMAEGPRPDGHRPDGKGGSDGHRAGGPRREVPGQAARLAYRGRGGKTGRQDGRHTAAARPPRTSRAGADEPTRKVSAWRRGEITADRLAPRPAQSVRVVSANASTVRSA